MGRISAEMIAAKLPKVGAETRSSFLLSKYIDLFEEHKPLRKGTPSTEATVELNKFIRRRLSPVEEYAGVGWTDDTEHDFDPSSVGHQRRYEGSLNDRIGMALLEFKKAGYTDLKDVARLCFARNQHYNCNRGNISDRDHEYNVDHATKVLYGQWVEFLISNPHIESRARRHLLTRTVPVKRI